jgi:Tfp pilus assembly PilM family ATPase
VADHIPMSVEDAEIDYWTLDDYTSDSGDRVLRLLLVAAASDMVESFVGAASSAGLQPAGVDLSAFAVARAVSPAARRILDDQVASLVSEIHGSIEYYLSQDEGEPISSVIVTGGGSLVPGLFEGLQDVLRTPVRRGSPFDDLDASKSGLTQEQLTQVEQLAGAAIGLGMGRGRK